MRRIARALPAAAGAALLALIAGPLAGSASALDLVANGKFDAGVAGWGQVNGVVGTLALDPGRDAGGSPRSGSLEMVHQIPDDSTSMWVAQCLPAQGGVAYFLGGKIRFREGESALGRAKLLAHFYAQPDCTAGTLGIGGSPELHPDVDGRGVWRRLAIGTPNGGVLAPAGAHSVRLVVFVGNVKMGSELTINADDLFAATVGTPVCDKMPATIVGTPGPDILLGTSGSDVIVGRGGADQIDGKAGNDRICGGLGNDSLYGGKGDDRLFGNGGDDHLYGAENDDRLVGGGGRDRLYGGAGSDAEVGGAGNDDCDGGPDADSTAAGCELVVSVP